MSTMLRLFSITLLIVSTVPVFAETKRPNVLFVVVYDLRNSVGRTVKIVERTHCSLKKWFERDLVGGISAESMQNSNTR